MRQSSRRTIVGECACPPLAIDSWACAQIRLGDLAGDDDCDCGCHWEQGVDERLDDDDE